MTRFEFQKEITRIIFLAINVSNPFVRGRMVMNQINELCGKLNL